MAIAHSQQTLNLALRTPSGASKSPHLTHLSRVSEPCENGVFDFSIKEVFMSEPTTSKTKKNQPEGESVDPVHVVRKGAIAASIWQRQSPSGFGYFDFSLSRSWKSMSTEKTGYSKSFFESNQADLIEVIQLASAWITANRPAETGDKAQPLAA